MAVLVQKFGGSSVADTERLRRCAQRAADARRNGDQVVVVVSAMGRTTDRLIELAREISPDPPRREMDQLLACGEQISAALMAMAIETLGYEAVSLTGIQAGILTDHAHTRARIRTIRTVAVRQHLAAGRIVVVAGFQGMTVDGDVTTLGRGGSDTTAVALAAALQARECEIYTDVDGIYTADPRLVPDARRLEHISYEEILELAAGGARVMALRSILLGMRYNVPIHVRHSMLPDPGTRIVSQTHDMEAQAVTGVALRSNLGRISLTGLPAGPDVPARIFDAVARAGIVVDDIIQTGTSEAGTTIIFTVDHADLADIRPVLDRVLRDLGRGEARVDVGLCKVSAVGAGMRSHAEVAAAMFRALARTPGAGGSGIRIENITTSDIRISCLLAKEEGEAALRAIHEAFGLGTPAGTAASPHAP